MLAFSPDSKTLANVTANRTSVALREAATGKELHRFDMAPCHVGVHWR